MCSSDESLSKSDLDAILILFRSSLLNSVPYRKIGKNRYRRGGRTYTLKQIQAIEASKNRKRKKGGKVA